MLADKSESKRSKWRIFGWIAMVWLTGWLGITLMCAAANTDVLEGAMIGGAQGWFMSFFFLLFTLPLGALGLFIGNLGKLRPYRTAISLLLSSVMWIAGIGKALYDRASPELALKQWTGVDFPRDGVIKSHSYFGGGLVDDRHVFVLHCRAAETARLIRELTLKRGHILEGESDHPPEITADGWKPAERWQKFDPDGSPDYLELITDQSRSKVYLVFGQI